MQLLIILLIVFTNNLWACSSCLSGDPTLTLMGTEKGYKGRFRMGLDILTRSEEVGIQGFNLKELEETRFTLGLAYSFSERITLSARIPYLSKKLTLPNLSEQKADGLGDIEINTKFFFYNEKDHRHKHLYGFSLGARLPTASEQENLDIDVQLGTGSFIPTIGAWYGYYNYPWFFYTSANFHITANEGFQDFKAGNALVNTFQVQYAFNPKFALSLALDTRYSVKDKYANVKDDDSGGLIGFLTPGLVFNIKEDLIFNAVIQIPVIDNLNGEHEEKAVYQLGIVYDF